MAPPIELRLWFFKFYSDKFGVMIDGYRASDDSLSDMSNWRTTMIKKATGRLVETVSGSQYKLIGDIDVNQAKMNGYPDSLIDMFKKGFPSNWENTLREYYQKFTTTNPLNAATWFNHKISLEKRRESAGVNLEQKRRQSRKTLPLNEKPITEESQQTIENKDVQEKAVPIRQSPRAKSGPTPQRVASIQNSIMATPSVANMATSITNNIKSKDGPTPRFVPNSAGRFPRGVSAVIESPSLKAKEGINEIPVQDIGATTPCQKRAPSESPKSSRRVEYDPEAVATRTRSASVTPKTLKESLPNRQSRSRTRKPKENQAISTDLVPVNRRSASVLEAPLKTLTITELPPENTFKIPQPLRMRGVSAPAKKHATILANWFIKFLPEMLNKSGEYPPFILVGINVSCEVKTDANQSWHTTMISKVEEGNKPEDCSFFTMRGTEYKTTGKMSFKDMASQHQWFTRDLVSNFALGFPNNWKTQLWAAFERYQQVRKSNLTTSLNPLDADANIELEHINQKTESCKSLSVPHSLGGSILKRDSSIKRTNEVTFSMPLLDVERGGSQRIGNKKRMVEHSSSDSDDNQAIVNTLKAIKYEKNSRNEPRTKRIKLSENDEASIMKRIQKKKAKLSKEIQELDRIMIELASKMQEKWANSMKSSRVYEEDKREQQKKKRQKPHIKKQRSSYYLEELSESSEEGHASFESDSENTESSTTETDASDNEKEWYSPRKKTSKKQRRAPKKDRKIHPKTKSIQDVNKSDSEDDEVKVPKKAKKKTWREFDFERLKRFITLHKIRCEDDWIQVSEAVGPDFTPEECRNMAIKRLNWKQPVENSKNTEEGMIITAKQGTQAYKIQSDEQSRKYMLGAGSQEGDCFRQQVPEDDEEDLILDGDLDDSILAALQTPKLNGPQKKGNKRGGAPSIPTDFIDEDTPRLSRKSKALNEPSAIERENHQRYLHQITNNRSYLNTTKANLTHNVSMMDRSRAVENVGRNIDKIKKNLDKQVPKKKNADFLEEEEEDEEMM